MNLKKTLILAAFLAVGVVYLQKVLLPSRDRERSERIAFSRVSSDAIESLEVSTSEEESKPYILDQAVGAASQGTQGDRAWNLRGVSGAIVDKQQIAGLVAGLTALEVEGPLDERETGYDVSVFGLDKPALAVTLTERGGARTEVAFGKKNEYLSKRYVKVSGRKGIFLADEAQFLGVNKTSTDIRSKTPCSFKESDLRSLVLVSKNGRVKLDQSVVGAWRIVEPSSLGASTESVRALLTEIKNLRVEEFVDHASSRSAELGLDSPVVTVTLSFREGVEPKEITYKVSARQAAGVNSGTYVGSTTTDTVYKLEADPVAKLAKSVDDLRERKLVPYEESDIKKLSAVVEDGSKVEIAVSGVAWTINGKQSDPVFTQQYLKDVASFAAAEFPKSIPPDAFQKPMLTLEIIKDAESNQRLTVTIGAETKGANQEPMRYVKTSASDTVYAVRDIEAKRVVPREEALIERATPAPK